MNAVCFEKLTTAHALYAGSEELMHLAFPHNERRADVWQRWNTDYCRQFTAQAILWEGNFVGLLHFWDFTDFIYIEHFALLPEARGKGLGTQILQQFIARYGLPVLLEVEPPTNFRTLHRVAFYHRLGFVLHKMNYKQPSYHADGHRHAMRLMTYGPVDLHLGLRRMVRAVYHSKP